MASGSYTRGMAMVMLSVSEAAAERLQVAAAARGVSPAEMVDELVATLPDTRGPIRRRLALAGIGETEHGITSRIDEQLTEGFGRD